MHQAIFGILIWLALAACSGETDPFERVRKLRALGVESSPLVAAPSTDDSPSVVTLVFHLLVPEGNEISAEAYVDEASIYSLPVEVQVNTDSVTYEEYAGLRHYTVSATVPVPKAEALAFSDENNVARLRYSVLFTSAGEEEKVVGTIFIQRPEDLETFQPLSISIVAPTANDPIRKGKEIDIEAELTNENDEPVKVGWFVSDGRIENRRAKKTKWETGKQDKQLLVATIRGLRSRSFAVQFMELQAQ